MTTTGSVILKGRVGWGIWNSWVKQPLGLWCWWIPLLAVDLMLRWIGEKLRSGASRGIWCYEGKMPTRWVSGWLWVKCTTSVECKPIQIAESSVMDGWKDHYIAQCRFGFKSGSQKKNGERCRTEYSEGTVVAWVWVGVLAGYCWEIRDGHVWLTLFYEWRWSCSIDLVSERKRVSPFLESLQKKLFYKCF
jgi:hypothetical protein